MKGVNRKEKNGGSTTVKIVEKDQSSVSVKQGRRLHNLIDTPRYVYSRSRKAWRVRNVSKRA